jgi:hypothetical protein
MASPPRSAATDATPAAMPPLGARSGPFTPGSAAGARTGSGARGEPRQPGSAHATPRMLGRRELGQGALHHYQTATPGQGSEGGTVLNGTESVMTGDVRAPPFCRLGCSATCKMLRMLVMSQSQNQCSRIACGPV